MNRRPLKTRSFIALWGYGMPILLAAGAVWLAAAAASPAQRVTVNPVGKWTPVLSEFLVVDERYYVYLEPPYTPLATRIPSLVEAWETLQPMVKIRLRGSFWPEDEPVISGWKTQASPEGASDLVVMSSQNGTADGLPLRNIPKKSLCNIRWHIQIWGKEGTFFRIPDHPEFLPAMDEYQEAVKQKILVRDFSFKVYKLEGPADSLQTMRGKVAFDPYWEPKETIPYNTPLSECEAKVGFLSFHAVEAFYEAQLSMKLYFPELDDQTEKQEETKVEAAVRFMCLFGSIKPAKINY